MENSSPNPLGEHATIKSTAPFLTAEWRDLVAVNYEISPETLAAYIPAGTELDLFEGRALVSLVAFRFLKTRVLGVRVPFHSDFEEINLRFYVSRNVGGVQRRAVVFIKELVPRFAIATVARVVYNENYFAVPMGHSINTAGGERCYHYEWSEKQKVHYLKAKVTGVSSSLTPGSEAEFIFEHYWGYSRSRGGGTIEYEVSHPRWEAWSASHFESSIDFERVYGPELASFLGRPPRSVFAAVGSAVTVHRGTRLPTIKH